MRNRHTIEIVVVGSHALGWLEFNWSQLSGSLSFISLFKERLSHRVNQFVLVRIEMRNRRQLLLLLVCVQNGIIDCLVLELWNVRWNGLPIALIHVWRLLQQCFNRPTLWTTYHYWTPMEILSCHWIWELLLLNDPNSTFSSMKLGTLLKLRLNLLNALFVLSCSRARAVMHHRRPIVKLSVLRWILFL